MFFGPGGPRPQGLRALMPPPGRRRMPQPPAQPKDAGSRGHDRAPSGGRREPEPEVERVEVIGELELEAIRGAQELDAPDAFVRGGGEKLEKRQEGRGGGGGK